MAETSRHDTWRAGDRYETYMGRWSRKVAPHFLNWLGATGGLDWLDVGCGTGALTATILADSNPRNVVAIDLSEEFISMARAAVTDDRVEFRTGNAEVIDLNSASRDVVVSALALNFVPDRIRALAEMKRVVRPSGTVGFYVWDYPGSGLEFVQSFWDVAKQLDGRARDLAEDRRFGFCSLAGLAALMRDAGLPHFEHTAIQIPTIFRDFEAYWQPFTLGSGPAPGYCASLEPPARENLKRKLRDNLVHREDGSICLKARAFAIKTVVK
jgi:SAM-dependent methyltransferase